MKKLVLIIMVIAFPFLLQAQTKGEKLHAKYSNIDGFNSFSFAGSFLKNLDFDVDEDELEKNITGDCKTIKFLSLKHLSETSTKFKKLVSSQLAKGDAYKEILKDRDKDSDDVHFYAKANGKKKYSEFHVLHYNKNRTSLVSFFGDFKVEELKTLSHFTFDEDDKDEDED